MSTVSLIRALAAGLAGGVLWMLSGGVAAALASPGPGLESKPIPVAVVPPPFIGNSWLNVTQATRLTLASCKGKVVIVHFWTFGCINCKHNLPFYQEWQKRFATNSVVLVGIHTPETAGERDPGNVAKQVRQLAITYPVLLDPAGANWRAWHQQIWPTVYLVDKRGRARYAWEGELEYQGAGGYAKMTALIEALLKE
jgi:thiol-disulfide isomerase/thioredoxin